MVIINFFNLLYARNLNSFSKLTYYRSKFINSPTSHQLSEANEKIRAVVV